MAKNTKRTTNPTSISCPCCEAQMELTFIGEKYGHYFCRKCETSCEIPNKLKIKGVKHG